MPGILCHILPTAKTPEVLLDSEGLFLVKGRSLVLNKTMPPEHLLQCIDKYLLNPAETTTVVIAFEYLNSFGTQILIASIKKLSKVILQDKKIFVKWYYDEEDEDILERGHHIAETFNIPIEFIPIDDISRF